MRVEECGTCCWVVDGYVFDFGEVLSSVEKPPKTIVLEAPQGLVKYLELVSSLLEKCFPHSEITYRLEPAFGLCSISLELSTDDVVVVHIGHEDYPYPLCSFGSCTRKLPKGVFTVTAEYIGGDAERISGAIASALSQTGGTKVAIGFSVQHKKLAGAIVRRLSSLGFEVRTSVPITGCWYAPLLKLRSAVDSFVVIAGGYFHAIGLGLALAGSSMVYRADPYANDVEPVNEKVARILSKRLWKVKQAMESGPGKVAVISGLMPGQSRPGVVSFLKRLGEKSGYKVRIVLSRYMQREYLDNLSPEEYKFFVVASCPRIAIEDLDDYWKPVLTPGEARMVFERTLDLSHYRFPW